MHSIEGKRGEPTPRPPFPAVKGLFGKPTILNNVETYANVPQIILNGADWFASMGTEKSKGTKVFALGGKINNTGLVEVPMGTPLREIIYDIGGGIPNGKKFKAVQTGGPSGGCLPASPAGYPRGLRQPDRRGLHDGLRRYDRHGRGQLYGGYRPLLPGFHRGRKLRQVHPLPYRHPPHAGNSAAASVKGKGEEGDIEKLEHLAAEHQGHRAVRPGPDRAQPGAFHPEATSAMNMRRISTTSSCPAASLPEAAATT